MRFRTVSVLALVVGLNGALNAQTVDYGSLQELFGEPVTTSANGTPQRKSEVPLNMEIITQDQIRQAGARNIPDILRRYAGFSVRDNSVAGQEVSIRGYNQPFAERLLVLVNGRQVYLEFFGLVAWDLIPVELDEIQQIEVVRGPNTALFGFNAVSGVVNIVTNNPLYTEKSTVSVGAGSQDFLFGSATSSFKPHDRVGVRLSVGGFNADEFDTPRLAAINEEAILVEPRRRSAAGEIAVQVTDKIQMFAEGSYSELDRNDVNPAGRVDQGTEFSFYSARGRVVASSPIGLLDVSGYFNTVEPRIELAQPGGNVGELVPKNTTVSIQASDIFSVGTKHRFRIFGEYRNSDFAPEALDGTPLAGGGVVDYDIFSVSGLWNWSISNKFSTSIAVRYDNLGLSRVGGFPTNFPLINEDYDQTLNTVGFNIGAVWQATDNDTLRLTVARGIDIPSLVEFGTIVPFGPTTFQAGNPETQESPVLNLEVNYDRKLDFLHSDLRLAAFYQRSDDVQTFNANIQPIAGSTILFTGNAGDSEVFGFEISLEGEVGRYFWLVNYSYADINDSLTVNTGPVVTAPLAPDAELSNHTFNLSAGAKFGKFEFSGLLNYMSDYSTPRQLFGALPTIPLLDIDTNVRLDLRLDYKINDNFNIEVVGQGLLNRTFFEGPLAPLERRVFFRARAVF